MAGVGAAAGTLTVGARPAVAAAVPAAGAAGVFDVRAFGAKGDGNTLDTDAINRAIEAAAAAGGGTVCFPAGSYLSYSIHLKSNVELHLGRGATLLAADSPHQPVSSGYYDQAEPNPAAHHYQDFGHTHFHNSLIWGEGLENIAITGPGLIYGRGLSRGLSHGEFRAENQGTGNKSIALKNCRNVLLRDFAILKGGHFGILATGVDNLTIDNLTIDTNRDGMDIDCCRNVRVSNCTVNSPWDDGICLKSSYALGYARATEMVTITNCLVSAYQMGSVLDATFKPYPEGTRHMPRTGRIKFGTESNGGFKNITISNCVFEECQGLALESVDGALLEDVTITNLTMRNISSAPLFLRLGRRMRGPSDLKIGTLKRVVISNVVCYQASPKYCSIISGIPNYPIEDVKLSNIMLYYTGGAPAEQASLQPPEGETGYPGPQHFGLMPAYGFFVRHAKNLEFDRVEVRFDQPDPRPAFILQDVDGVDFAHLKAEHAPGTEVFALQNVKNFSIERSRPIADAFLEQVSEKKLS